MELVQYCDFLWNNNKIAFCEFIIDYTLPIIQKSKISKKDFDFAISVLNLCNLIYRQNTDDDLAHEIYKKTLVYYPILFSKTIDK